MLIFYTYIFINHLLFYTTFLIIFSFDCSPNTGLLRLQSTSIYALQPLPSATTNTNRTTTAETTPPSKSPDLANFDAIEPTHTTLPMSAIRSAGQLMPSPSGMMLPKSSSANLHATNALPSSAVAAADNVVNSDRRVMSSTAAVVAVNSIRQSMFASNGNLLNTNSLSVAMPNSDIFNSNLIANIASSVHTSSLFQPNQVASIAEEAAFSQTTKPLLLHLLSTRLLNSADIHSPEVRENTAALIMPTLHASSISNSRISSFSNSIIESNLFATVIPIDLFSESKRTVHIAPSSIFSTIYDSSETTVSTILSTVLETLTVHTQIALPSTKDQSRSNSNIFSSNSIDFSAVQSSNNPPLYIDTLHSGLLQATEQMYRTGTVYATSTIDTTVYIEPSLRRTSKDFASAITETTTIVLEGSETITSTVAVNSLQSSSPNVVPPLSAQNSFTSMPRLSTVVASSMQTESLSAMVTEFSTVTLSQSLLDLSSIDSVRTILNDKFTSFVTTTVLEDSTLYLSPSVHFQPTLSLMTLSSNFTTLTPVLPYLFPSHTPYSTKINSLEPSGNVFSSDVFVTSTMFEPTAVLTRELTSMLTTLYPNGSLSTSSLPLMTILHASSAATAAVQLNSSVYQSTLDTSLSSEIISSQFAYSSIANESSRFNILPPLPVATSFSSGPNLQLTSTLMMKSVVGSESLPASSSLVSGAFLADSTMLVTLELGTLTPTLLPMTSRYRSDVAISSTQTPKTNSLRTESFIFPTRSSFESLVPSSTIVSSSATPPLIPIKLSVSLSHSAQKTVLVRETPSLSSTLLTFATKSIPPLPPEVVSYSDTTIDMIAPTPSVGGFVPPSSPSIRGYVPTSSARLVIMPTPTPTPNPVIEPSRTDLDTSFATKPYWVSFGKILEFFVSSNSLRSFRKILQKEYKYIKQISSLSLNLAHLRKILVVSLLERVW